MACMPLHREQRTGLETAAKAGPQDRQLPIYGLFVRVSKGLPFFFFGNSAWALVRTKDTHLRQSNSSCRKGCVQQQEQAESSRRAAAVSRPRLESGKTGLFHLDWDHNHRDGTCAPPCVQSSSIIQSIDEPQTCSSPETYKDRVSNFLPAGWAVL